MPSDVTVYTAPPEAFLRVLKAHTLHSLPLIRRLRFTQFPGGMTEHTKIIWSSRVSLEDHLLLAAHTTTVDGTPTITTSDKEEEDRGNDSRRRREEGMSSPLLRRRRRPPPFAAAYLDLSRGPETELWIYSSMESRLGGSGSEEGADTATHDNDDDEEEEEEVEAAVSLLREVKRQQDLFFVPGSARAAEREFPTILVGNLNEVLRERLVAAGMAIVSTGLYDKWFFKINELPDIKLPDQAAIVGPDSDSVGTRRKSGSSPWVWDAVRPGDIPLTILRTNIPRKERTMKLLPSTALYLEDGTPVGWAFLGPDSSLSSLHCEEPYRRRGIAKAIAVRVLRDHVKDYGDDNYGWADVAPDNTQSRGVCKSLNGKPKWQISWSRLDLDKSFPDN